MSSGNNNAFYGSNSGYWFDGGWGNTFIGAKAGRGGPDNDSADPAGNSKTVVGSFAGYFLENASENVILGYGSGGSLRTGVDNVFIGNTAGSKETGSNKLYIINRTLDDDDNPITPLIYGDFSTHQFGINTTFLSKTLNVGGDAYISGNLSAGSITAPVTGNVSENINGATNGKVYFSAESGIVTSVWGGLFDLYWDNSTKTLTLRNTHASAWCWFTAQKMLLGTSSFSYEATGFQNGNRLVVPFASNGDACVISFGDQNNGGYCTVWLQYSNSKLFGHYIKY